MTSANDQSMPTSFTLGTRWYCVNCGRDCPADGVPFVVVPGQGSGAPAIACECCVAGNCSHLRPIVIECDKCHRPAARLSYGPPKGLILGSITPEGQMTGGSRTSNNPRWNARIWDVSPSGPSWERGPNAEIERYKLVCVGKRHRIVRIVASARLPEVYAKAHRDGRSRLGFHDL
jgi:hypothetical protein